MLHACVWASVKHGDQQSDQVTFGSSLDTLAAAGVLHDFLARECEWEVSQQGTDPNTLFRERSSAVLFFAQLSRRPEALEYLSALVAPVADALLKATVAADLTTALARIGTGSAVMPDTQSSYVDLEIDPSICPDLRKVAENSLTLMKLAKVCAGVVSRGAVFFCWWFSLTQDGKQTQSLLDAVIASLPSCPPTLRYILSAVHTSCRGAHPSMADRLMSSIFFLRFLLPALCAPDHYGIGLVGKKRVMPQEVRRALVKISKLIQGEGG